MLASSTNSVFPCIFRNSRARNGPYSSILFSSRISERNKLIFFIMSYIQMWFSHTGHLVDFIDDE